VKPVLPKKLLRSLPTLTEVVNAAPPPSVPASPAGLSGEDALVERVLQRLAPALEERIQQAVATALEAQMKELGPRIRQRVDYAVRKALAQDGKAAGPRPD
jgi:hypothetical protein